jgi:hypothetical protein
MCDFEDFDIVSRYTRSQAVDDGILVELTQWHGMPVMATTHLIREVSRGQLIDVWEQFKVWKEAVEQTLPEEERLFATRKNGKRIWVIEDPEAFTLMYPEDYWAFTASSCKRGKRQVLDERVK